MQLRFGQLEKHLKSSLAARKGAWKVKIKNNFSGPEKFTKSKSISAPGGSGSGGSADFDRKYGYKAYVLKVNVSPFFIIFKVHS